MIHYLVGLLEFPVRICVYMYVYGMLNITKNMSSTGTKSGILEDFGLFFEMCLTDLVASTSHAKFPSKAPSTGLSRTSSLLKISILLNERPRDSYLVPRF